MSYCYSCHFSSSLLPPIASMAAAFRNHKRSTAFFVHCCATGPTDSPPLSPSPTPTNSRKWVNPLRLHRSTPSDHPSPEIPHHRKWVESVDAISANPDRFTVVSYNILGDFNAFKHRDLYPDVPLMYMKWPHRKQMICRELIALNPDIICMQEVDKYFDLLNVLEKAGYAGSYKRRTGDKADGCATFWKADKFRLLEGQSIEYQEFALRDNVAQLSVFETCRGKSKRLLVGNIHVIFRPSRGDVKLGQLRLLTSRAQSLSEKWGNVPLVLAGDFNCTPQSAIYKFLSSSELNVKLYNRRELSGQKSCHPSQVLGYKKGGSPLDLMDRFFENGWTDTEIRVATGSVNCDLANHPLNLTSSYATVKGSTETRDSNGEPLATSYHSKFLGTVDYLWYSEGLSPTRVLDTLPLNILRKTGGLPCNKIGSDHLALVSEFAFIHDIKEDCNINSQSTISAREAEGHVHD